MYQTSGGPNLSDADLSAIEKLVKHRKKQVQQHQLSQAEQMKQQAKLENEIITELEKQEAFEVRDRSLLDELCKRDVQKQEAKMCRQTWDAQCEL